MCEGGGATACGGESSFGVVRKQSRVVECVSECVRAAAVGIFG